MTHRVFMPMLLMALVATSSLAAVAASAGEAERSAKASQKLGKALQGHAAGKPTSCIPNRRGGSRMEVIDDSTVLFRDRGIVYVQNLPGRCPGLASGAYTLVTRQYGSTQLCQGDINQLVDLTTGAQGGSCVFGPFVPYRRVG